METPKPKPALLRWMPALGIVLVVGTSLMFMVCAVSDGDVEPNIRELRAAAENLRKNPQDKQSLSLLLNQLSHRNGIYRSNAAAVLGEAVEGADHVSAAIAPEAVPALVKLMEKPNQFDQRAGAGALRQFGPHARPALPALRKGLTPSDRDVAWFSAEAIRNIGSPAAEAVPELTSALKQQLNRCRGYSSPCSRSFIPAIGAIGPGALSAKPDLEVLLEHEDLYLRMAAAVALLQIDAKHERAHSTLAEMLKSDDAELKERTLRTLKESGIAADELMGGWKVDSARTSELMIDFHQNLLRKRGATPSKSEALRQAALKLMRGPYSHPTYWAGFILIGDDD